MDREATLAEFTAFLDREQALWEEVMQTGDTAPLEASMADEIVCCFGAKGMMEPEFNDRESIVAGMRESVAALKGCRKRFQNRLIRMRSETEAVVFFEQVVDRGDQLLAQLLTVETWRKSEGKWRCIREMVEHV